MGSRLRALALVVISIVLAWAMVEGALLLLLRHPAWLPSVAGHLKGLYRELDRSAPQLDPECARFDPELLYTLKPGECVQRGREFVSRYSINRLGVRDDELSLDAPEIVVLGDSYAMGWGVSAEESFPQLLERRLGRRVLDAGVSSYGTVRELLLLRRIDLSKASHVILQYCDNDQVENAQLVAGHWTTSPEAGWRKRIAEDRANRRYWFGKYSLSLLHRAKAAPRIDLAQQAKDLVTVLEKMAPRGIGQAQLVLFAVAAREPAFPGFLEEVRAVLVAHPELPSWIRDLKLVEIPAAERFVLDDHWTARGHAAVADALLPALNP